MYVRDGQLLAVALEDAAVADLLKNGCDLLEGLTNLQD